MKVTSIRTLRSLKATGHQITSWSDCDFASLYLLDQANCTHCWALIIHETNTYPIGPLQLEITWYKIHQTGVQKNVPDSKTKRTGSNIACVTVMLRSLSLLVEHSRTTLVSSVILFRIQDDWLIDIFKMSGQTDSYCYKFCFKTFGQFFSIFSKIYLPLLWQNVNSVLLFIYMLQCNQN